MQLLVKGVEVEGVELLMRCIHKGSLISHDQVAVISRSFLQAKLNIKAVPVPVERADADGVVCEREDLWED